MITNIQIIDLQQQHMPQKQYSYFMHRCWLMIACVRIHMSSPVLWPSSAQPPCNWSASRSSEGCKFLTQSREFARDNILSPHFRSRRIAARRAPFYRRILKNSKRGQGVAPRVYAECNSVLHVLPPRILHSAGGPYIALMPTCED